MDIIDVLDRFKDIAREWESYESGDNSDNADDIAWARATEDTKWECADQINELISEIEDEIEIDS